MKEYVYFGVIIRKTGMGWKVQNLDAYEEEVAFVYFDRLVDAKSYIKKHFIL